MPLGVLTDNLMVALGGILGGILKSRISDKLKENLNLAFGVAALGIGITLVVKGKPAWGCSLVARFWRIDRDRS